MKVLRFLAIVVLAVPMGLLLAGQIGLLSGRPPRELGATGGRLSPPSLTPNSVSSQAELYPDHPQKSYATIAPLGYTGDGEVAMKRLAALLQESKRTVVVTQRTDYIYAQSSTALLNFTDDLEFFLDKPNNVIQVRSASRLGQKDFGVNRARMEAIRVKFAP